MENSGRRVCSLSSSQDLSLTTLTTTKPPFQGMKIAPWAKPEDGLGKCHITAPPPPPGPSHTLPFKLDQIE